MRNNEQTKEFERIREGKENREKIFKIIYDNREHGARSKDLIHGTGLSKQAVHHNHLNPLLDEKRIYKKNRRYYPEISTLNEIITFSQFMKESIPSLINKAVIESNPWAQENLKTYPKQKLYQKIIPKKISFPGDQEISPDLSMYLMKIVLGSVVSEKYCRTNFGPKQFLERCLFEFSNRVGAYMTYIFTQALYPFKGLNISNKDRTEFSKTLINNSISVDDLFDAFRYLITELGLSNCDLESNEHKKLHELPEENFKTLSVGIRTVYRNLYDGLENWWFNATNIELDYESSLAAVSNCAHVWEKRDLFKLPPCYVCSKCHLASVRKIKEKKKSNR